MLSLGAASLTQPISLPISDAKSVDELQSLAVYARDRVNPYLFNYALSVAMLHRPDTQGVDLPTFIESFPDKFLDARTFGRAREEAAVVPQGSRMPIVSSSGRFCGCGCAKLVKFSL